MQPFATILVLIVVLSGCGGTPEPAVSRREAAPARESAPANKTSEDTRPVLICFGDSLTAGYGVAPTEAFPALLQQEFDGKGYNIRVVNAGLSGDTTSGGLDRLPQVLALKPAVVLLELGANDGLRGMPIALTRKNLEQMIVAIKDAGASVVLAGMTLPRNYGADFIGKFEKLYADLSKEQKIPLLQFELEPLARQGLLQPDGMHPTAEGYRAALPKIAAGLEPVVKAAR